MSETPIHFLVYLSTATHDFNETQLVDLLAKSRANNERDEITGMLLYKDRRFMQVLEGAEKDVRATFARIERDPRHQEIVTLLEGDLPARDFPQWWMGFKAIDSETAKAIPGFTEFLHTQWSTFDFASDPSQAHRLLRVFRRM